MTYAIHKKPEKLSSRQRVLNTFAFQPVDRLAIDYSANPSVHGKLAQSLGLHKQDYEGVLQALGVDYRAVSVGYTGKPIFENKPGVATHPVYGFHTRWMENAYGGYDDFCDFPLLGAEAEKIATFPVADPDDFNYDSVAEQLKKHSDKALYIGDPGFSDIINATGRVMGMEQTLIHLMEEDEATMTYIERRCKMEIGILERLLSKAKGRIDFMFLGEDLGTQQGPLISLDLYRRVLKPFHRQYTALAQSYNIPVMMHSCGSSSWVYEDFIDIGIKGVDTLQPEATNMSATYLKQHFGSRLSFHGGISTAGALAYGGKEELASQINQILDIYSVGGGYHFAPTHLIQDNTPIENIITMYQVAHAYEIGE